MKVDPSQEGKDHGATWTLGEKDVELGVFGDLVVVKFGDLFDINMTRGEATLLGLGLLRTVGYEITKLGGAGDGS